jgi:hypothetical protein
MGRSKWAGFEELNFMGDGIAPLNPLVDISTRVTGKFA